MRTPQPRGRHALFALGVALLAGGGARAEAVVGDLELELSGDTLYLARANRAALPPPDAPLALVSALPSTLCEPVNERSVAYVGTVVLAARGGCPFTTKLRNAHAAGAALLVVYGTIDSLYETSAVGVAPDDALSPAVPSPYALLDACAVDCGAGAFQTFASENGFIQRADGFAAICARACPTGECAAAGVLSDDALDARSKLTVCCLPDELMVMNLEAARAGDGAELALPMAFASRADGARLVAAAHVRALATARLRRQMVVDPSVVVIWLLGCCAVVAAAWLATAHERTLAALVGADGTKPRRRAAAPRDAGSPPAAAAAAAGDGDDETLHLTAAHAVGFVVVASLALVSMFFLLQLGMFWVIRVVQVFFCVGCVSALFHFCAFPLVHALQPRLARLRLHSSEALGELSIADGIALAASALLVLFYFFKRHSPYAWALQDVMAFFMCAMFLRTVRLPNVRVGAILLGLFFCYDIFMVFVSPLIFNKSVMVEVATAGAGGASRAEAADNGRSCARHPGERMPVLFMVPRFDFGGGYAMLGLGDVVMPGLLVTFALRYDIATRAPRFLCGPRCGPSYYAVLAVGYALGLLLALLANVLGWTFNGVRGQPALLYLVPCTLGPLALAAAARGELRAMWTVEGLEADERAGGAYEVHTDSYVAPVETYLTPAHSEARMLDALSDQDAPSQQAGGADESAISLAGGGPAANGGLSLEQRQQGRPLLDP